MTCIQFNSISRVILVLNLSKKVKPPFSFFNFFMKKGVLYYIKHMFYLKLERSTFQQFIDDRFHEKYIEYNFFFGF